MVWVMAAAKCYDACMVIVHLGISAVIGCFFVNLTQVHGIWKEGINSIEWPIEDKSVRGIFLLND